MAKKFTKLNLGDVVASVGGRAFRKLSAEESTSNLISFTINELSTPVQYQAEKGMTWREWCESEYDNSPIAVKEGYVIDEAGDGFVHKCDWRSPSGSLNILNWVVQYNSTRVSPTDIIQADVVYDCKAFGGSND